MESHHQQRAKKQQHPRAPSTAFCVLLSSSSYNSWHTNGHSYGHGKVDQERNKNNKVTGIKSNKGTGVKSDKDGSKSGKSHEDFYQQCAELLEKPSKSREGKTGNVAEEPAKLRKAEPRSTAIK